MLRQGMDPAPKALCSTQRAPQANLESCWLDGKSGQKSSRHTGYSMRTSSSATDSLHENAEENGEHLEEQLRLDENKQVDASDVREAGAAQPQRLNEGRTQRGCRFAGVLQVRVIIRIKAVIGDEAWAQRHEQYA